MLNFFLFGFLFSFNTWAQEFIHHPAPTDPKLISADNYQSFKSKISPPPTKNSPQQKSDEAELFKLQKERTDAECNLAKTEVHVGLAGFLGAEYKKFDKNTLSLIEPFFEQIRNDTDYFIQKLKKDFPRDRPYLYIKGLNPCVPKEVSKAYPSGHSAISEVFALVLGDLFPTQKNEFELRAKTVRDHRVLAGIHHRTDVETGKFFAEMFYEKLIGNENFKKEIKILKAKLAAIK